MNFAQLSYLLYLSQCGSLSKTADHFFTSHQVIRNAILSLEDEFHLKLVHSTSQGTSLTPAGLCVAQYAQKTFADLDALKDQLQAFRQASEPLQKIHLCIVPAMANDYYLDLFDSYTALNPAVQLDINISPFPQMLENLASFEHTICLTFILPEEDTLAFLQTLTTQHHLQLFYLANSPNYICVHKNTPYAQLETCTFADFADMPLYVFLNSNPLCDAEASQGIANLRSFGDYSALKRVLKDKQGAVILQKHEFNYYFGGSASEYVAIPLTEEANVAKIALVTPTLTAAMQDFLTFLRRKL